jgi:hypothetical protein
MRVTAHRSLRYLVLVVLALAASAGASASPSSSSANGTGDARLLVKFRTGTSKSSAAHALSNIGAHQLRELPTLNLRVVSVPSSRGRTALGALRRNRSVDYAEPDAILAAQELLPNDPSFPQQYAVAGGAWGWYRTRTTQAWDVTRGDASVVIAVLDTGLRPEGLADFDGQVMPGWNIVANSSDTRSSAGAHGTYVAGVAGLAANNGLGNAGYCPDCRIMPVQIGTDSGAYVSDIAGGITWAADHGARVANISFGGPNSSSTLTNAVAYARARGVVITAAAGNSNCDCLTYPAATPGVIGVAGTSNSDAKQGDSNYGTWVKVAAPEGNMTSWPAMNGAPGYAPLGGTSLAAPVVAGIAGLLLSAKSGLSGAQVEQALEMSAAPMAFPLQYGRVDALSALNYLGLSDPQPQAAPTDVLPPQILLETNGDYNAILLAGSRAPQPGDVLLRGQGAWTGTAPLSLASVQWQRCDSMGAACTIVGTTAKYTVQATDAGYTLRLSISVKNGLGVTKTSSRASQPVGGSPLPLSPSNTSPPTITGLAQAGQTLAAGSGTWSGAPTSFAFQWNRCGSSGTACVPIAGSTLASYGLQPEDIGSTIRVTVTAANSVGQATASSDASQPVAVAPSPLPPAPGPNMQTLNFSGSLTPKVASRTFSVTTGTGSTHAELAFTKCSTLTLRLSNGATLSGPSVVNLDSTLPAGTYVYTVSGGRCSFTLTITAPAS